MEEFKKIVADLLDVEISDIEDDLEQGDIPEWDSVGHLELLMGLSKHYDKKLSPAKIPELINLQDIYSFFNE